MPKFSVLGLTMPNEEVRYQGAKGPTTFMTSSKSAVAMVVIYDWKEGDLALLSSTLEVPTNPPPALPLVIPPESSAAQQVSVLIQHLEAALKDDGAISAEEGRDILLEAVTMISGPKLALAIQQGKSVANVVSAILAQVRGKTGK